MQKNSDQFGYFRRNFFPVYKSEFPKMISLNILAFLVTCIYSVLRAIKDTYVVSLGGGQLTTQLKLFAVIPFVILIKIIYDKLGKRAGFNKRFYIILGYFAAFLLLVYFKLHSLSFTNTATDEERHGFSELVAMEQFRKGWVEALIYIHAEAFGTIMLGVTYWQFVNSISSPEQAKRCYPTLAIGSALAALVAGTYAQSAAKKPESAIVVVLGLMFLFALFYFFFTDAIAKDPAKYSLPRRSIKVKKKKKLGLIASLKVLAKSPDSFYLLLILSLVLCYNAGIVLFETAYKDLLKKVGGNKEKLGEVANSREYTMEMIGFQLQTIGVTSLVIIFFVASRINRQGWRFTALVVPVALLMGTLFFFGSLFYNQDALNTGSSDGLGKMTEAVKIQARILLLGLGIVVFVKSFKYVSFDTSKERAYLVSSEENRDTGKSAVDGVGSRFGKAVGAGSVQLLRVLTHTNTLGSMIPVFTLIFGVVLFWIYAVLRLSVQYKKASIELEQKETSVIKKKVA